MGTGSEASGNWELVRLVGTASEAIGNCGARLVGTGSEASGNWE